MVLVLVAPLETDEAGERSPPGLVNVSVVERDQEVGGTRRLGFSDWRS